ncbi:MAG: indole-3-glycerol phosphate synthase TrpC [Bacteroidetes bacterium]|jgi:indole-3-glycerol phosphate synthase|nr:indole-3-glycerol phosphate synthase TrpC [Bacteroidota bacterium]
MNILDTIIARKKEEVAVQKSLVSESALRQMPFYKAPVLSMSSYLTMPGKTGIIAEFKRKSPSKGIINDSATVEAVTAAYSAHGASGLSVLTDTDFFGGSLQDLTAATIHETPILRKDFMVDPYQIIEAKAYGAEVILLIAACLSPLQVKELASVAKDIGLEVLLEIHTQQELGHVCDAVDMVGINNRNLKTFEVDLAHSIALAKMLPAHLPKIAESGISQVSTILELKKEGFDGFLIGENFMKTPDPAAAFAAFVADLKNSEHEN